MPMYVVYTKETHTGKYVVEADNPAEAIEKVRNDEAEDRIDSDFEYFQKPENGGWSAWHDGEKMWVS